jgi:hypothetical protein
MILSWVRIISTKSLSEEMPETIKQHYKKMKIT